MDRSREAGFTLFELAAVVSVVSMLLVTVLIFMHPKDFSALDRNAQRQTDVAQLMQVVHRYTTEHGTLPPGLTDKPQVMGSQPEELNICRTFVPAYLPDLPRDPVVGGFIALNGDKTCNAEDVFYSTGYTIQYSADGQLRIAAPDAEAGAHIELTRQF